MTRARPTVRPAPRPRVSARSSRASGASTSQRKPSLVAKWRGTAKSTPTRATSCGSGGRVCPTSATSKRSATFLKPRSSAAASLARTSAARARGRDSAADGAVCGRSSPEPFAKLGRKSWSSKTSGSSGRGGSTKSSRSWPKQGSMRSGRAFERPTSVPHIAASGCSFWPTPTASSYGSSQNGSNSTRPSAGTPGLARLGSWWPTPCASDARDSARHTTRADAVSHAGTTLTDKIRKYCSRHARTMGKHGRRGRGKAVLSPEFVETLLGLPEGYTLVDDVAASDALEGRSCHSRRQRLF